MKWFLKEMHMVYWKTYSPKPWGKKNNPLATQGMRCSVPHWACIFLDLPPPFHCGRKYITLLCYFICTGSTGRTEKMPFWQTMTGALPKFVAWRGSGVCVCVYGFVCTCCLNAYSVELWHPVRSRHLFSLISFFHQYANNSSRAKSNKHTHVHTRSTQQQVHTNRRPWEFRNNLQYKPQTHTQTVTHPTIHFNNWIKRAGGEWMSSDR